MIEYSEIYLCFDFCFDFWKFILSSILGKSKAFWETKIYFKYCNVQYLNLRWKDSGFHLNDFPNDHLNDLV